MLATHDLEIRGAGELLGESQSGELTEIGLTMYLDMLEQAVKALKEGREPVLDRPLAATAEVELRLPALLPESYVADVPVRLAMYKRLAAAPDNAAIDELTEEIVDRFGPLPPPATNLLRVARLKLAARAIGIRRLDLGPQGGYALFEEQNQVDPRAVIRLVQHPDRDYRLEGALKLRISVETDEDARALRVRREVSWPSSRARPTQAGPEARPNRPIRIEDSDPLYFAPMTTTGRFRSRLWLRAAARADRHRRPAARRSGADRARAARLHHRAHRVPQHQRRRVAPKTGASSPWRAARTRRTRRSPASSCSPCRRRSSSSTTSRRKLQNTSNYQPIAHFAWQQTASSWGSRAGFTVAKLAGSVPGLSGIIYLESGTYLHLGMSLNYQTSNPPAGLAAAPGTVFMLNESRRVKRRQAAITTTTRHSASSRW